MMEDFYCFRLVSPAAAHWQEVVYRVYAGVPKEYGDWCFEKAVKGEDKNLRPDCWVPIEELITVLKDMG